MEYGGIDFTKEYGIYGEFVNYGNDLYIVLSLEPIEDNVSPVDIIRRDERHAGLFYPKNFAVKHEDDVMLTLGKCIKYCQQAEFIRTIYKEFDVKYPVCLRRTEVSSLMRFNEGRINRESPKELTDLYEKYLKKFFKHEKCSGLRKKWLEFFRSDRFEKDASRIKNYIMFLKRKTPKMKLRLLFDSGETVNLLEMREHEYIEFKKVVKEYYPDVFFCPGKKLIVNHGMVELPGRGKPVTYEEFCKIRDRDFATKGYKIFENLNISYWEFRNIYYKAADEPIIAQIYNSILMKFAKCNTLRELMDEGEISYVNIPIGDVMGFTFLARENNIPFYIDTWGEFQEPSLYAICIVYNTYNNEVINSINRVIIDDKVERSHTEIPKQNEKLSSQISNALKKSRDCFPKCDTFYEKPYIERRV